MTDKSIKDYFQELRYNVERGFWQLDLHSDPDSTQFSYCVYCHVVEYRDHYDDCRSKEVMESLDKIEALITE